MCFLKAPRRRAAAQRVIEAAEIEALRAYVLFLSVNALYGWFEKVFDIISGAVEGAGAVFARRHF